MQIASRTPTKARERASLSVAKAGPRQTYWLRLQEISRARDSKTQKPLRKPGIYRGSWRMDRKENQNKEMMGAERSPYC
ncbi:hypothetical protein NDU88_007650 [Pleurodeles waltl]|uniref:Uncharacterized protein n=1 Tax=Pleurodeles waltl TaxID=8319 RepID=A0AAV7RTM9_PLEWA|nr:hypothetical protein NDU88_007650 [Pleurodeles waltl]